MKVLQKHSDGSLIFFGKQWRQTTIHLLTLQNISEYHWIYCEFVRKKLSYKAWNKLEHKLFANFFPA